MKNLNFFFLLLLTLINLNTLTAQFSISGQITCLGGSDALPGQEVQLSGNLISNMTVTTDANGNYSFPDLPTGGDYVITIEQNEFALGGVTTFDLVLLMKHVLGVEPLPSPFHLLAADVNGSGTITTIDALLIRQLILAITTTFPNGSSSKFATSDFDPANSMGSADGANITDLQENQVIDFVRVKLGDLNGSADCQ